MYHINPACTKKYWLHCLKLNFCKNLKRSGIDYRIRNRTPMNILNIKDCMIGAFSIITTETSSIDDQCAVDKFKLWSAPESSPTNLTSNNTNGIHEWAVVVHLILLGLLKARFGGPLTIKWSKSNNFVHNKIRWKLRK